MIADEKMKFIVALVHYSYEIYLMFLYAFCEIVVSHHSFIRGATACYSLVRQSSLMFAASFQLWFIPKMDHAYAATPSLHRSRDLLTFLLI